MIADVKPGPTVKAAWGNVADVIRREIVAKSVALICAHPKFVSPGSHLDSDGVADSPRLNFLARAIGIELKMRARSASAASSETLEREPIETYIFFPSVEKMRPRVQWPPPVSCA